MPDWCHGNYDFLQIDQKTMKDYANNESAQNRFCGTSTPPVYTSDSNMLILWMKTNSDTTVGTGFTLTWEEAS